MNLTGPQRKQRGDAMLAAFPSVSALSRLASYHMSENLAAIVGGGSLADQVFELIGWAVARAERPGLI